LLSFCNGFTSVPHSVPNGFTSVPHSVPNGFTSVPHSVPNRYISVFLSFYFATWPELAWTLAGLGHIAT
jgi:hypothetical protein